MKGCTECLISVARLSNLHYYADEEDIKVMQMRNFITDDRLHRALDEVESWLDYKIKALPMPERHKQFATCGMGLCREAKEFKLWYIEGETQSQATYCHELTHIVQWINGNPSNCSIDSVSLGGNPNSPEWKAWNLVQHIPVWHLVKEMGFDESETQNEYMDNLIQTVSQGRLYTDAPLYLITPLQAIALASGLSRPATPERHAHVRKVAAEKMPQSLELAEVITLGLKKYPQPTPQEFLGVLALLLNMIGVPTKNLKPLFLDKTCPNFRSRILAVVNDATH